MTIDAIQLENNQLIKTPICIIGSGAAGIILAIDLAQKYQVDVTVLESSRADLQEGAYDDCAQSLYSGQYEGKGENNIPNHHFLEVSRRRFYGGSTNCWAGWVRPMNPYNFTKRPGVNPDGWPVTYEDLLLYYQEVQKELELGDFCYDDPEYWVKKIPGMELPPIDDDRMKIVNWQVVSEDKKRFRIAFAQQMKQPRIQLIRNSNVLEIETNESGNEATGLRVGVIQRDSRSPNCQATNKTFKVQAKQYIVACGGIESIRLLLLSNHLGNHSGLLGRYFFTHPTNPYGAIIRFKPGKVFSPAVMKYFNPQPIPGTEAHIFTALEPTDKYLSDVEGAYWRVLLKPYFGGDMVNVNLNFAQTPHLDSQITLSEERDYFKQRKVNLHYLLNHKDEQTIKNGLDLTRSVLKDSIISLEPSKTPAGHWWPQDMSWAEHHMGATRMSDHPDKGVLDKNMKIHSVSNVYVCSSSAWPSGDISNPTMTIIAFAHRLAQHLYETYYQKKNLTS